MRVFHSIPDFNEMRSKVAMAIIQAHESYDPDPVISPLTLETARVVYSPEEFAELEAMLNAAHVTPAYPRKSGALCFEHVHTPSVDTPLPSRGTAYSAGYDIYLPKPVSIGPGETVRIWTGVRVVIPYNMQMYLNVVLRSSLGTQLELICSGIIDQDYAYNEKTGGDIGITVRNRTDEPLEFAAGDRIAQGILLPYAKVLIDVPRATERTGGHGSTN